MTKEITFESLAIRKLADKSESVRITRFDPDTGERKLVNPTTPGEDHEPWPLLGIRVEEAPEYTRLSTKFVQLGKQEGWIEVENERPAFRPGGPANDPWRADKVHTFLHVDTIIFKTLDGDVRYEPFGDRGQPDKYDGDTPVPSDVDGAGNPDHEVENFYTLRKVS
jgi:hypothetical protein